MNFLELFNKSRLIGAHRGANTMRPENTLAAMKASLGRCDFIEIDVQLSSDGHCVIIHDDTLERTTNISEFDIYKNRKPYLVSDFTLDELKKLDYGSWFNKEYEPLLRLCDALEFVKRNNLHVNVEIKDMSGSFSDIDVVSHVIKDIQNLHVQNRVLISSFRHEYLLTCKKILPKIATAALVEIEHPSNLVEYLKSLHVDVYNMDDEIVDEAIVKLLREEGFFVNVYTVNDMLRADELFDMGVNGIFSDVLNKEK